MDVPGTKLKMSTVEFQIAERTRKYKEEALHNLHQFIDVSVLRESYGKLNKHSAKGVDGITWQQYGEGLEERLPELLEAFKSGRYRAPAIRRVYIPKDKHSQRPIGIPSVEDKVLQASVRRVISPILSNVYLHYVLDEWFTDQIQPLLRGKSFIVRYADDFILGFSDKSEAQRVMEVLPKRFARYKLTIHPEKTKLIDLNSQRGESDRSFDFLGFTHYLGKSRKGKKVLKRKTSTKRLTKAITRMNDFIRENRHMKLGALIAMINVKLRGHYVYYGITFNYRGIKLYYEEIKRILRKWIRRRGGKTKWTFKTLDLLTEKWRPLTKPLILKTYAQT